MGEIVKNDDVIAKLLNKLGIDRKVNSVDRTFYKTWLYDWKLSEELIDYAVSLALGKYMPMQYLNKILSEYHVQNVTTIDDAKKYKLADTSSKNISSSKDAKKTEYTKQELDSLFDDINEIEI